MILTDLVSEHILLGKDDFYPCKNLSSFMNNVHVIYVYNSTRSPANASLKTFNARFSQSFDRVDSKIESRTPTKSSKSFIQEHIKAGVSSSGGKTTPMAPVSRRLSDSNKYKKLDGEASPLHSLLKGLDDSISVSSSPLDKNLQLQLVTRCSPRRSPRLMKSGSKTPSRERTPDHSFNDQKYEKNANDLSQGAVESVAVMESFLSPTTVGLPKSSRGLSGKSESSIAASRRMTVELGTIDKFMEELDGEMHAQIGDDNRRLTADGTDMAELIANIDDEEYVVCSDNRLSGLSLRSSIGIYRESLESVDIDVLLHSVNGALKRDHTGRGDDNRDSIDTLSSISSISFPFPRHANINDTDNGNSQEFPAHRVVHTDRNLSSHHAEIDSSNQNSTSNGNKFPAHEFSAPKDSTLKSCMSGIKSNRKAGVVFGSPQAMEFSKNSETNSFTPMSKAAAKINFPVAVVHSIHECGSICDDENDDITSENSRILDEWDRLTNTSRGSSASDEEFPPILDRCESFTSKTSGISGRDYRRRSSLQPSMNDQHITQNESKSFDEPTCTVQLPSNLGEFLNDVSTINGKATQQLSEDKTEALESNLESLIDKIGISYTNITDNPINLIDSRDSLSSNVLNEISVNSICMADRSIGELMNTPLTLGKTSLQPVAPSSFDFDERRTTLNDTRNSYEPTESLLISESPVRSDGYLSKQGQVINNEVAEASSVQSTEKAFSIIEVAYKSTLSNDSCDNFRYNIDGDSERSVVLKKDNAIVSSSPKNRNPLLERLTILNTAARKSTLSHCQTPFASAAKFSTHNIPNQFRSSDLPVYVNTKQHSSRLINSVATIGIDCSDECSNSCEFTEVLSEIQVFHTLPNCDIPFLRTLSEGGDGLQDYFVDRDVSEILLGAISEANLKGFSDESLESQWLQISDETDFDYVTEALKINFAASCVENIDGKYKLWEARLLEIGNDAMILKLHELSEKLNSSQQIITNKSEEVLKWEKHCKLGVDIESEMLELLGKIYDIKEKLEKITGESVGVGRNISSLLKMEQITLSARVANVEVSRIDQLAAFELNLIEKTLECRNLEYKIGAMNKLTCCKITEMMAGGILVVAKLSDICHLNAYFKVISNGSLSCERKDVRVEIFKENNDEMKIDSSRRFVEKVIMNELFLDTPYFGGINVPNYMWSWQRKVSGCIFAFKTRSDSYSL